jgi:hypothetical protein
MRRIYALIILLLGTAPMMSAQETPKFEFFGGYSFAHADAGANAGRHANLNGWNSSVAYNFNKWIGIVLDGGGTYGSAQLSPATNIIFVCPTNPTNCPPSIFFGPTTLHQQVHTYSIGPQLSYRTDSRFTPFAHVLFGGGYASNTTTFSGGHSTEANGSHVIISGGGFDVRLTSLLALRTQGDFLRTHFFHEPHDGFRVSTGIVFRFGKK